MDIDATDALECPHEETMEIMIQTSSLLDADTNQQCRSPALVLTEGVPRIGMKFESEDHAYRFYNTYAELVGFSVRKDFKNRNKIDGSVMSRRFVCFKRGFRIPDKRNLNVKRPHKEVRTGCLAQMTISRQPDGKYRIIHFEANHNHEVVSTEEVHTLPSHRKVTVAQAIEADLEERCEIQQKLTSEWMGNQENLEYLPNEMHSKRMKGMKGGEAGSLLCYFQKQQSENPPFFYSVRLDVNEQVSNVFWADARMLVDYSHFGDVVYFDTTYRTNQLCRPLAAFIGVNHHKEMVLFGAALLYDETSESFQWLFQTFVQAMSGKKPKTILTIQDPPMAMAIKLVFPQTSHRICIWHMWQNVMKHLGHLFDDQDAFGKDLRNCIYEHEKEKDFFKAWEDMLEKYCLQESEWLQSIFNEKEKWAMVYGRRTYCAGARSTQLSESFNSCLRKYFKSDLDLLQFFNQFEMMVADLRYKELEFNNSMSQRIPILKASAALLKHAWDIYTPNVFEVFQKEFENCCDLVINSCNDQGSLSEYEVSSFGRPSHRTVTFNSSDNTVNCSCMKFEFSGVLCSHSLKVLDVRNVKAVPEKYILKRWTRSARVESVRDADGCIAQDDPKLVLASRYKDLSQKAVKLSMWAAESEEGYLFLNRIFKEGMLGLERIYLTKFQENESAVANASTSEHDDSIEHTINDRD